MSSHNICRYLFISMGRNFIYFSWKAGLPISSVIKYHSCQSNISIFLFFFKFVNLENQNKFLLPFISMAVIYFYFLGVEGHPPSTDTKNHNFRSNISIFLFIYISKKKNKKNFDLYFNGEYIFLFLGGRRAPT